MTDTPLALKLKDRIRREGPISVAAYMQACLHDEEHGYYRTRPAIGAQGDFVTAPEISQAFGEMIGLWCAVVWQQMGAPARINLVELGPGRGTLMRDALRAGRIVPGFRDALAVHLVESNTTLRTVQEATLAEAAEAGLQLHFDDGAAAALTRSRLANEPTIVVANEFLDALPVSQAVHAGGTWHRRTVALGDRGLQFAHDEAGPAPPAILPADVTPRDGDVLETCAAHGELARALAANAGPLAGLFIDYGHARPGLGDTLQGVAGQAHVSPFHAPGETDLSAQVDFSSFADACRGAGLATDGPIAQAAFLGRLGIVERASRLMGANPARAAEIEAGVARLIAPSGMGSRFLALGVRSHAVAALPGFGG